MRETRSAVVLTRIAKQLRKKTGNMRYRARVEDERASLKTLVYVSCTRPLCTSLHPRMFLALPLTTIALCFCALGRSFSSGRRFGRFNAD